MHEEMLVSNLPLPWHSRPCGDVKVFGTSKNELNCVSLQGVMETLAC